MDRAPPGQFYDPTGQMLPNSTLAWVPLGDETRYRCQGLKQHKTKKKTWKKDRGTCFPKPDSEAPGHVAGSITWAAACPKGAALLSYAQGHITQLF